MKLVTPEATMYWYSVPPELGRASRCNNTLSILMFYQMYAFGTFLDGMSVIRIGVLVKLLEMVTGGKPPNERYPAGPEMSRSIARLNSADGIKPFLYIVVKIGSYTTCVVGLSFEGSEPL